MKQSNRAAAARYAQDPWLEAFRRGDYQAALGFATDPFLQANTIMQTGKFAEAEQLLRQFAGTVQEPKLAALLQCVLGQVLMHQNKGAEAMECFQKSVQLWPERGSTHRDIAEVLLRRGDSSAEALRWARLAVEKENAGPGLSEDSKNLNLAEDTATLAWAVAVHLHDVTEVDRLDSSITLPAITPVSSNAQIHYHLGQAYAALGNSAASAKHFEYAAMVNANGIYGRAAAAMIVPAHQ
jgi:tetratricopeptide (TPR) repeat protein